MEGEVTNRDEEDDRWSGLTDIVLIKIFGYLCWADRFRAGLTCRWWHCQLSAVALWKRFAFIFSHPKDGRQLCLIEKHGRCMEDVSIDFNPCSACTRDYASELIGRLSKASASGDLCLKRISVVFSSEPPMGHRWADFTEGLVALFRSCTSLIAVDLARYNVSFDDSLLLAIACSSCHLKRLDIQNECLVTQVTPAGLRSLLESCKNIEDLSARQASISDECIDVLTRNDRSHLRKLNLASRGQEKYTPNVSWDLWTRLAEAHPGLEVSLAFDGSCPVAKMLDTMALDIPVTALQLLSQTAVYDELWHISRAYARTLKVLVVDAEPGPAFEQALLHLCSTCASLQKLHIVNFVSDSTMFAVYGNLSKKSAFDLRFGS